MHFGYFENKVKMSIHSAKLKPWDLGTIHCCSQLIACGIYTFGKAQTVSK